MPCGLARSTASDKPSRPGPKPSPNGPVADHGVDDAVWRSLAVDHRSKLRRVVAVDVRVPVRDRTVEDAAIRSSSSITSVSPFGAFAAQDSASRASTSVSLGWSAANTAGDQLANWRSDWL